jgi:hypothetical protein
MIPAEDSARRVCDGRQGGRDGLEVNNACPSGRCV